MGKTRKASGSGGDRETTMSETSGEIAAPPAKDSARGAGASDEGEGSLRDRDLRVDNISKEVELDWEASSLIEKQPGAYARDRTGEQSGERRGARAGVRSREAFREREYRLPERLGRDRLVLMARDPRWIYAYWELDGEKSRNLKAKRSLEWGVSRPLLRLYDLSRPLTSRQVIDVALNDTAQNWYVAVNRPRHRLVAEIGRAFDDGFVPFARSNEVWMPPELPSMELGEEWATWDARYGRFVGKSGPSSPGAWGKKIGD